MFPFSMTFDKNLTRNFKAVLQEPAAPDQNWWLLTCFGTQGFVSALFSLIIMMLCSRRATSLLVDQHKMQYIERNFQKSPFEFEQQIWLVLCSQLTLLEPKVSTQCTHFNGTSYSWKMLAFLHVSLMALEKFEDNFSSCLKFFFVLGSDTCHETCPLSSSFCRFLLLGLSRKFRYTALQLHAILCSQMCLSKEQQPFSLAKHR